MTAAALSLAAAGFLRRVPVAAVPSPTVRFSVPPPASGGFAYSVEQTFLAVSPDGSQLVYVASAPEAGRRLWLRTLAALEAQPIPGTEGAVSVFWSPDGRSIGFFAGTKLKRLDLPGTSP